MSMALASLSVPAQNLNGFNIQVNDEKVVVLVNGQQVCNPTLSCFVANLQPGPYTVEVYRASEMRLPAAERQRLYSSTFNYSGSGVRDLLIVGAGGNGYEDCDDSGKYLCYGVMDRATFREYCKMLKNSDFDSRRLTAIESMHPNTRLTSRQCRDFIKIFDFDSSRVKALEQLYPFVVDPVAFEIAIDALDFDSGKYTVRDFVKKYNQKHNGRR